VAYCPKCKYEYQPGIWVCPDCHETLVDKLPPTSSAAVTPDESWVPVGKVASQIKSEMAKGALDSNNIPSVIFSSTFKAHGRGLDFATGLFLAQGEGNIIMVPREFREEALVVLEGVLGDDLIQPERQL
jgi:hypothetical protein